MKREYYTLIFNTFKILLSILVTVFQVSLYHLNIEEHSFLLSLLQFWKNYRIHFCNIMIVDLMGHY